MKVTAGSLRLLSPVVVATRCLRTLGSAPVDLTFEKYDAQTSVSEARPPLVILHGLFGHKQNWHSVSKALNKRLRCTVFAVDLRNHGDSPWTKTMSYEEMAVDVSHFLNYTVPKETHGQQTKIHLLGHSMGGKTAMKVALSSEGESLLESLIVEDMVPKRYATDSHRRFPDYLEAMKKADLTKPRHQINSFLAAVVPELTTRQFLLTNLVGKNGSCRWRLNLETIGNYLESMCDVEEPKGIYSGRSLFISGERSPYVTQRDHRLIHRFFPQARFVVIGGAGHWVHAEKPYDFMDAVARFIEQQ